MGILSLKPSSFIINLGITLVLSGLIMVFIKQKFASYDKQFQIIDYNLKNLLTTVQKQTASFASSAVNWCSQSDSKVNLNKESSSLAAEGALDAAKEAHEKFGTTGNILSQKSDKNLNKIVVSDNEEESESYTDDDESNSDSETEESENEESEKVEEIQLDNLKLNGEIKQIFITNEEPMHFLNNLMVLGNHKKLLGETLDLDNLQNVELDDNSNGSSDNSSDDDSESESENEDNEDNENNKILSDESTTIETKLVSLIPENIVENVNASNETPNKNEDQNILKNEEPETIESLSPLNMSVGQLVEMSKNNLQELCKSRNLSIKGSKKELIDRLLNK